MSVDLEALLELLRMHAKMGISGVVAGSWLAMDDVLDIIAALGRAERVEKALRAVADEGCYFAVYGEGSETWRDCGKCGPCFARAALAATPGEGS
jgi:hypothetical protein